MAVASLRLLPLIRDGCPAVTLLPPVNRVVRHLRWLSLNKLAIPQHDGCPSIRWLSLNEMVVPDQDGLSPVNMVVLNIMAASQSVKTHQKTLFRVSAARYALPGGTLNEDALVEALRPPVPRAVFDAAVAEVCEKRRARAAGGGTGGGGIAPGAQEVGVCSAGLGATRWMRTATMGHRSINSSFLPPNFDINHCNQPFYRFFVLFVFLVFLISVIQ